MWTEGHWNAEITREIHCIFEVNMTSFGHKISFYFAQWFLTYCTTENGDPRDVGFKRITDLSANKDRLYVCKSSLIDHDRI